MSDRDDAPGEQSEETPAASGWNMPPQSWSTPIAIRDRYGDGEEPNGTPAFGWRQALEWFSYVIALGVVVATIQEVSIIAGVGLFIVLMLVLSRDDVRKFVRQRRQDKG
jgi:hypothetical protein